MNKEKTSKRQWQTAIILFALSFILVGIFVYVEGHLGARTNQMMDIPPGVRQSLENSCITAGLACGIVIGIVSSGAYVFICLIKNSQLFKRSKF